MYKKMLVPLDGSERAQVALPYAARLARSLRLEVVLLNVCPENHREFVAWHRNYIELMVQTVEELLKEPHEGREPAGSGGVTVSGEVLVGEPAGRILSYSSEKGLDFILLGTYGESASKRMVMGSIVDKVLQASRVPIWLVPPGVPEDIVQDKWPRRTVLVPLDGSDLAEAVLPHVETLVRRRPEVVDVVLLLVCESTPTPSFYPPGVHLDTEEECYKCRMDGEQYLAGIAERLKGAGANVQSMVLVGNAADQIIDYAAKNRISVIVMATHGRAGVGMWTYGSVAERVLMGIKSPVLLVRPL